MQVWEMDTASIVLWMRQVFMISRVLSGHAGHFPLERCNDNAEPSAGPPAA